MRRGRGGITRNSHHSTGRLSRPISSNGSAKESGRPIMRMRPTLTVRTVLLFTIMPLCRYSNSSAAERLVVWVENNQSSLLASRRISSRCAATRAT